MPTPEKQQAPSLTCHPQEPTGVRLPQVHPHSPNTTQIPELGGFSHVKQTPPGLHIISLLFHSLTPCRHSLPFIRSSWERAEPVSPWLSPLPHGFSSFRTSLPMQPTASLRTGREEPGKKALGVLTLFCSQFQKTWARPLFGGNFRGLTSHCWFPHSLWTPSEEALGAPIPLFPQGEHRPNRMPTGGGGRAQPPPLPSVPGGKRA